MKKLRVVADSKFYTCDMEVAEKGLDKLLEGVRKYFERQRMKFIVKDDHIQHTIDGEKFTKPNYRQRNVNVELWKKNYKLTVNIYHV